MKNSSVLITGGAGFIGSRLVARVANMSPCTVVLDNLHAQVHGPSASAPVLPENAIFIRGDIRDAALLRAIFKEYSPSVVYHLASETGTGQSHDEAERYCDVNINGTIRLLEAMRKIGRGKFVLASSRAVYGEGAWIDPDGHLVVPAARNAISLSAGDFSPKDAHGRSMTPVATTEASPPKPASIYASTKLMQELLVEQLLANTDLERVILRFQNVYGPGQSLRNPYTGVLSNFCGQILRGEILNIFEDGAIVRDFVFVDDVVEALLLATKSFQLSGEILNIGSGRAVTIISAAKLLLRLFEAPSDRLFISGAFREGDIRYAVGDISRASELMGWKPVVSLERGLRSLVDWAREEWTLSINRDRK